MTHNDVLTQGAHLDEAVVIEFSRNYNFAKQG